MKSKKELTTSQNEIIKLLSSDDKLTQREISERTGVSERYVRKVKRKYFNPFKEHCDDRAVKTKDVDFYWDKSGQFSMKVHPSKPKTITVDDLERLYLEKLKNHKPNYEGFKFTPNDDKHLLVIDIADAHFGKLASYYETKDAYNLEITKQKVYEGVSGLLDKAKGFGVDRVLFIIGNDVLHIDNPFSKTTAGTHQNTDGMYFDMFNVAFDVYVNIIESLCKDFYVDILFNPSNHDFLLGWTFAQKLEAWFRSVDNITFDCDMRHRKYYQYGLNMIESDHGDGCKEQDTPMLMAQEEPIMWSETKYRYSYKHHLHHKRVIRYNNGKDYIGVTIEYLRSPSSSDSWHHRNGYTGNKKAIEGFIHHKEYGQIARITHHV